MSGHWDWRLWWQWIAANALAELVGLGTVFGVGVWLYTSFHGESMNPVILALLAIGLGGFEGFIVGACQGWVLRSALNGMPLKPWVIASVAGALAAWTLGMLPSTLMSMSEPSGPQPQPEISKSFMWLIAVLMGMMLGVVLGIPQWIVLKRYVPRAGWWIPANSAAWAFGMATIFIGIGSAMDDGFSMSDLPHLLWVFTVAGANVGIVHGFALLKLLQGVLETHEP